MRDGLVGGDEGIPSSIRIGTSSSFAWNGGCLECLQVIPPRTQKETRLNERERGYGSWAKVLITTQHCLSGLLGFATHEQFARMVGPTYAPMRSGHYIHTKAIVWGQRARNEWFPFRVASIDLRTRDR